MSNLSLYQIADEYMQDLALLETMDLDDQTFQDTLEGLSGAVEAKATAVAMFIQNLNSSAKAIKEAEEMMYLRRRNYEAKIERIKAYLLMNMQRTGITKIDCPHFQIAIRNNPASVVIDIQALIPEAYLTYPEIPPPQVNKKLIKEAYDAGLTVAGAHMERKQSIQIK